tara:strand:- start:438 stop:746 length:309 start_codon:yes stop_codon:yes gene_type:complete
MPSKYGFGNTRKKSPVYKKAKYGEAQRNPVMLTKEGKEKIMASDANPEFKKAIEEAPLKMYGKKSPAKAGQTAGQIVKRERMLVRPEGPKTNRRAMTGRRGL